MTDDSRTNETLELEEEEWADGPPHDLEITRRSFVQALGAGILITVSGGGALAQRGGSRGGGGAAKTVAARLHIGRDGFVTVLTGKVEMGQGSRGQLSQAAAEELRVPVANIRMVMADTDLVPDDGTTAGSKTTPLTVPAVRQGAATARGLLVGLACKRWNVRESAVQVRDGAVVHPETKRKMTYGDLARQEDLEEVFKQSIPSDVRLTPVKEWKTLGKSVPRPNRRDTLTGEHRFPSDITRPNMLYGKVLRPPSYGAKIESRALDQLMPGDFKDVVVCHDEDFVGCAAPTSRLAGKAVEHLTQTVTWSKPSMPSSKELYAHLKKNARTGGGGSRRSRGGTRGSLEKGFAAAKKTFSQDYHVAYVQHAPLEPRAAVAEWQDGKLTVWTGSQAPNRIHSELAGAFKLPREKVRVIIPDMGGGFGGKHTGECAVEAARLAKAAGRPVSLRWTREEEFTWAYFRPAALIEAKAGLDDKGRLTAWEFTNINSGGSAVDTPYAVPNTKCRYVSSDQVLRSGSYRCLAATANNFAREVFMDELAEAAGADPLAFRLEHLEHPRLRAVLETAAKRFGWNEKRKSRAPNTGIGIACGTEKGSYVAACAEVAVDRRRGRIDVRHICEVFECGAIQNPANLRTQVIACIVMGLGPALTEETRFEKGKIQNTSFSNYQVPRFKDVPELDIHLLNRPDLESAGGGETPIIPVAPAIANAVHHAAGVRLRAMPLTLKKG